MREKSDRRREGAILGPDPFAALVSVVDRYSDIQMLSGGNAT